MKVFLLHELCIEKKTKYKKTSGTFTLYVDLKIFLKES